MSSQGLLAPPTDPDAEADTETASSLVTVNSLRKICGACSLMLPPRNATGPMAPPPPRDADTSGKLSVLVQLLHQVKSTTDDRFVLISNFTSVLEIFQKVLKEQRLS